MSVGWLVKRGCYDFCIYSCAPYLLPLLVVHLSKVPSYIPLMISRYCICNIFKQHRFSSFGLATISPLCPFPMGENKSTIRVDIVARLPAARSNFIRKEWCGVQRNSVSDYFWLTSIYRFNISKWKIFFTRIFRWTYITNDNIASFQSILFYLRN